MSFYADEPEPPVHAPTPSPQHDRFVFATGPDGSEDPAVPTSPPARV